MITTGEAAQKRAAIVGDLHFRSLKTKVAMLQKVEEAVKQLEVRCGIASMVIAELNFPIFISF